MSLNHDGTHASVTLRVTLPESADPAMVDDLYAMLGLEAPAEPSYLTVTTSLILHSVPSTDVDATCARFNDLFPGCSFEVTTE